MSLQTLSNIRDMMVALREEAPELPTQQLYVFVMVALDEGTTAKAIEKMTGMTSASAARNVNALMKYAGAGREGLGWLENRVDPRDLRAKPLYLSDKGRAVLERILKSFGG